MDLQIRVRKQVLTCRQTVVAGSVNFVTASFMFDDAWIGTTKHVIFSNGDIPSKEVILDDETLTCVVPWEVLETPGDLYVSVVGFFEDSVKITTKLMDSPITVYDHGELGGSDPNPPTPSPWDKYDGELAKKADNISISSEGVVQLYSGESPVGDAQEISISNVKKYFITNLDYKDLASKQVSIGSFPTPVLKFASNKVLLPSGQLQITFTVTILSRVTDLSTGEERVVISNLPETSQSITDILLGILFEESLMYAPISDLASTFIEGLSDGSSGVKFSINIRDTSQSGYRVTQIDSEIYVQTKDVENAEALYEEMNSLLNENTLEAVAVEFFKVDTRTLQGEFVYDN